MYSEYLDNNKEEKEKLAKKKDKGSGTLGLYILLFVIVFGFGALIFFMIRANKKYTPDELEEKLIDKAKDYVKDNNINKEVYLDSVKLNVKVNKDCSQISGVLYSDNKYYPILMCKEYRSNLSAFDNKSDKITLNGESFIVLPKGLPFYDPMYSSKYNVRKFGGNIDQEGVYTFEYFVLENNVTIDSVKRKIIVVDMDSEKENYPVISVNGGDKINLVKGKDYNDSGAKAVSSDRKSLEVGQYNNVDKSKIGTYVVHYYTKDDLGRTAYAARSVYVVGSDYKLDVRMSKDKTEKTTEDVTITLEITGNSYKKIILPDKTESNERKVEYTVKENGSYPFTVVDVLDHEFTREVVINNIDKDMPTGSCEATVDGKNVSITVNATSKNEIVGYRYIIDDYQSDTTTEKTFKREMLNDVKSVIVYVKDKKGSEARFICEINGKDA